VYNGVHPHLIGSNRLEGEPAVLSRLDSLCNLDNALDVSSRQTRFIWANDFDLRAASKDDCAKEDQLTHRPNEK
jgi:hypothetical protein